MKMACALCGETIHSDLEFVDVVMTHHQDTKRIAEHRTYLCPDCAPEVYRKLGLGQ